MTRDGRADSAGPGRCAPPSQAPRHRAAGRPRCSRNRWVRRPQYLVAPRTRRRPMTRRRKLMLAAAAFVGLTRGPLRTGARPVVDHPAPGAGQQQHRASRLRLRSVRLPPSPAPVPVVEEPQRPPQEETGGGQRQRQREQEALTSPTRRPGAAVTISRVTDNSEQAVLVEQRDRILIITINRPQAKNAVNAEVSRGLADAMDRLDGDAGLSVGCR